MTAFVAGGFASPCPANDNVAETDERNGARPSALETISAAHIAVVARRRLSRGAWTEPARSSGLRFTQGRLTAFYASDGWRRPAERPARTPAAYC